LKKVRRSSSARKSRSSSKGSFFPRKTSSAGKKPSRKKSSFFPKIQRKTASRRKTTKPDRVEELKDRLIKPPNDPGPKIRGEETEVIDEYQESPGGTGVVQQAVAPVLSISSPSRPNKALV